MVTVRCLPSVLVILPSTLSPLPHPAHSWLLLLVSCGSFPSSFMRIQADMMLFFLFSFAHKCMTNTLVWALLFPKRAAVTKSCVRFCVSCTILWALKMLSWFYQIANIVYFLLIFLKTFFLDLLFIYFIMTPFFLKSCCRSSLLQAFFSSCGTVGEPLSSCGVRASHPGGFPCSRAQALGARAQSLRLALA